MKMNMLRWQTVDGVMKQLAVYMTVYNLVRLAMLEAAKDQGVSVLVVDVDGCQVRVVRCGLTADHSLKFTS